MDLTKAIRELHEEKRRIEQVIAHLETLVSRESGAGRSSSGPKKRGRKAMSIDERGDVSRRMKDYWAKRRKEGSAQAAAPQEAPAPADPEATS